MAGLLVNVLVHSPRDGRLIPIPCELVKRSAKTSRIRLPNGDVIKARNERIGAIPTGGNVDSGEYNAAGDEDGNVTYFVGQAIELTDGKRRLKARVSRIDEDGLPHVVINGKEFELAPEMLADGGPEIVTPAESPEIAIELLKGKP